MIVAITVGVICFEFRQVDAGASIGWASATRSGQGALQ